MENSVTKELLPQIYTDFTGLNQIKADAKQGNNAEAARAVSKQFESLFIDMMLRNLRQANAAFGEDNELRSEMSQFYESMFDHQVAVDMSQNKGLGLADIMIEQLSQKGGDTTKTPSIPGEAQSIASQSMRLLGSDGKSTVGEIGTYFSNPVEFVKSLWPYAVQTARQLGTDPRVLVAQAALETGWGKSVIHGPEGGSSFNLFGIKADPSWNKDRVYVSTLEVNQGVASREIAPFRRYDSFAQSFEDYAHFLQTNPRYQQALARSNDPEAFANALQQAGYATDPQYAQKIKSLMNSNAFTKALNGA